MRDVEVDLALCLGDRLGARAVGGGDVRRRLALELFLLGHGLDAVGTDALGLRRRIVRSGFELRLGLCDDRLLVLCDLRPERKLLMGGDAAVARAGKRSVRAALAGREDRAAAAGELLLRAVPGEGSLRLFGRELGVGLDV